MCAAKCSQSLNAETCPYTTSATSFSMIIQLGHFLCKRTIGKRGPNQSSELILILTGYCLAVEVHATIISSLNAAYLVRDGLYV